MDFIRVSSVGVVFLGLLCIVSGNAYAETVPGVVVDYYNPASSMYVASPSIAILSNGDYVASHDQYPGQLKTILFLSQDEGASWSYLTELLGQYESTLFVHDGLLYLIGGFNDGVDEYAAIRKSTDGGQTWTNAQDSSSGLLTPPAGYNAAPGPVLVHNNRIWRAIEQVDPCVPSGLSQEFRAMVLSAPADSNLLDASNWTVSNSLLMLDYMSNVGWFEGNVVATPSGDVQNILRIGGMIDKAAVIQVSSDGSTLTFSPQTILNFPGGSSKFTIRYDPQSDKYWSLVNEYANPPGTIRNILKLSSSSDLVNWTVEAVILSHPDSATVGFQYADWQFDDQDIVFVSRTAFGGSGGFHDAEFFTFHRIPNFRMLSQATTVTLDTTEDAEIDGHVNWSTATKGVPHPEWSHDASELMARVYDPCDYPGADASHVLLKWDVSGISSTDIITGVTLQMAGWDYADAPIDVYAIDVGDWNEAAVTWENWQATTKSLVLLGQLTSSGPASIFGNTTFSNPELTAWVQDWVDVSEENYGLILKLSANPPEDGLGQPYWFGDSFSAREDTWPFGHAPQLIIQHIPASAFATVEGTIAPDGYLGDLQDMGLQIELRQNGVPMRTERTLLNAAGDFSVGLVPLGTYDVAVKAFTYLQKVLTGVNVSSNPTDVGTIALEAGDLNGDSVVNMLDFAIMANNWLAVEE